MHPNKRRGGAQLPLTQRPLSGESTSHSISDIATCMSFRRLKLVTFKSHTPSTLPASASPAFQGSSAQSPTLQASACPQTPPLAGTPSLLPPRSWGPPPHRTWTLHHFRRDHKDADRPDFPLGRLLAERQPEAQVPAHRPDSGQTRHLVTRGSRNVALVCVSQSSQPRVPFSLPCLNLPCTLWRLWSCHSLRLQFLFFPSRPTSSPFKVWLRCSLPQDAVPPPKDVT